ncbi:toll-like receptor 13 isoform X1 [Drosophila busckii]|uniref:toll-like receptor 13 isoform X1 n=1 Tax=Drosophila busckii TaxID=30019 RepID=UPI0014333AF1|nr:toll-like receptor 13 isoform X1 [Drosophila busckii]
MKYILLKTILLLLIIQCSIDNSTAAHITATPTAHGRLHLKQKFSAVNSNQADYINNANGSTDDEADLKSLFEKYDTDDGNTCFLDNIKQDILWWAYLNGSLRSTAEQISTLKSLDLSYGNVSDDEELLYRTNVAGRFSFKKVEVFSAAYNALRSAPYRTLSSMGTLKYLSLQGNQFSALNHDVEAIEKFIQETRYETPNASEHECDQLYTRNYTEYYDRRCELYNMNNTDTYNKSKPGPTYEEHLQNIKKKLNLFGNTKESFAWATFPALPQLLELDISNCSIEYASFEAFKNVSNLRKLFISNNKILNINADTFYYIQGLQYLDLSFTNVLNYNYQLSMSTLEVVLNLVYGLKIHQNAFKLLPDLIYLDFSHSKITRNSAVAFAHLGDKLKYLSLCYTSFPMMSNGFFKNTALEGLDLSGNPFVSYNIVDDAFDGIGDTLKCLYFEQSNLKDIGWTKPLKKLQILGLAGNNINALSADVFKHLVNLQVIDLSSNHIGNWYKSVFHNNSKLRVLNLRSNNVNILTNEMLKDFESLAYLSLGENNFLCNCLLREVIEGAANNNKQADCSYELLESIGAAQFLLGNLSNINSVIENNIWSSRYIPMLIESFKNIQGFKHNNQIYKLRFFAENYMARKCPSSTPQTLNDSTLKFQLLDYDANHYWCFNDTDRMQVEELNCQNRIMTDLDTKFKKITTTAIAVVGSIVGLCVIGFLIYLKRWHIHYYYSSLKSAALLSSASKDSIDKFHHLQENDPSVIYDIFISYCQNDRKWVLDELLPNVEESGDVSICLHERDFQIGVTILDNIISCMDRSRSIMLVISSKFLLSHWCQFEMYLAQQRIFELSKDHLILVLLEDIPRSKSPKTLQYLMDVKTYIKWPISKKNAQPSLEERKLFWKRVRKSLELISKESKA